MNFLDMIRKNAPEAPVKKLPVKKTDTAAASTGHLGSIYPIHWGPKPKIETPDYRVIKTLFDLKMYVKKCKKQGFASFDFETAPSTAEFKRYTEGMLLFRKEAEDLVKDHARLIKQLELQKEKASVIKKAGTLYKNKAKDLEKRSSTFEATFEKAALDPHRNRICTMSLTATPNESRVMYFGLNGGNSNFEESDEVVFDYLEKELFHNKDVVKVAYNLIFEAKQLLKYKKYLTGPVSDPLVMIVRCSQIVAPATIPDPKRPSYGKDLKSMTREYLGVEMTPFANLLAKKGIKFFDEFNSDDPDALKYAAEDSDYALQLHLYWADIARQIPIEGVNRVYPTYYDWLMNIEMPFTRVIGQMEFHGMTWNSTKGIEVHSKAVKESSDATKELIEVAHILAERDSSLSPEQKQELLEIDPGKTGKTKVVKDMIFNILKVPAAKLSKITGDPSMDGEAIMDMLFLLENNLLELKEEKYLVSDITKVKVPHPKSIEIATRKDSEFKKEAITALKAIQRIQKAGTILSSHIDGRTKYINPITGRIHSQYSLWVETSRLSSSKPNGQNIPRPGNDIFGVRSLYQAAEGKVLVLIDYSGFELRLMGWKSGDETIIDIFNNNGDMHMKTASVLTGKDPKDVTKEERSNAKAGNFGISYGGTEHALQTSLKKIEIRKSLDECLQIVTAVKTAYPGIPAFQESIVKEARNKFHVDTIFGYKRLLPNIRSSNGMKRSSDERRAANTPIQGSAADIMKRAQNRVHDWIADKKLHGKVDMIGQVHDEIVLEVDNNVELIKAVVKTVTAIMEDPPIPNFPVTVVAEADIAEFGWGDKISYNKWMEIKNEEIK